MAVQKRGGIDDAVFGRQPLQQRQVAAGDLLERFAVASEFRKAGLIAIGVVMLTPRYPPVDSKMSHRDRDVAREAQREVTNGSGTCAMAVRWPLSCGLSWTNWLAPTAC